MKHTTHFYTSEDGVEIFYQKWLPNSEPIAVMQIAHGMAEHSLRYANFAEFLTKNNIAVFANDYRGHGKSIPEQGIPGYFADKDGWEKVLNDMHKLTDIVKTETPNIPIFLLGHSMGSFLSRKYLGLWSNDIDGIIISGTGSNPQWLLNAGINLASMMPRKKPSKMLDNMVFGKYNKPYPSQFQWLTSDQKIVDDYVNDPLCGFVCTGGFFVDMLKGLKMLNHPRLNDNVDKNFPIFIFYGTKDPVGEYGKGVKQYIKQLEREDFKNITEKIYYGGRHEMLNEINKNEVYNDILDWISKQLSINE
jgi:alpha-beta hydrolase superfamily lysophospholipase